MKRHAPVVRAIEKDLSVSVCELSMKTVVERLIVRIAGELAVQD